MTIPVSCSQCGRTTEVDDTAAGTMGTCECGMALRVPDPAASEDTELVEDELRISLDDDDPLGLETNNDQEIDDLLVPLEEELDAEAMPAAAATDRDTEALKNVLGEDWKNPNAGKDYLLPDDDEPTVEHMIVNSGVVGGAVVVVVGVVLLGVVFVAHQAIGGGDRSIKMWGAFYSLAMIPVAVGIAAVSGGIYTGVYTPNWQRDPTRPMSRQERVIRVLVASATCALLLALPAGVFYSMVIRKPQEEEVAANEEVVQGQPAATVEAPATTEPSEKTDVRPADDAVAPPERQPPKPDSDRPIHAVTQMAKSPYQFGLQWVDVDDGEHALTNVARLVAPGSGWQASIDPIPEAYYYPISSNLKIQFASRFKQSRLPVCPQRLQGLHERVRHENGVQPTFADRHGPFVIGPPAKPWESPVYSVAEGTAENEGVTCTDQPGFPVYDIRSGEVAGEFSCRIPYWKPMCLSPDGMTLVTLDPKPPIPPKPTEATQPQTSDEIGDALHVWRHGKSEPAATVAFTGTLRWMSFVDRYRIAAIIAGLESSELRLIDVTKRTDEQRLELPGSLHEALTDVVKHKRPMPSHRVDEGLAAISPGAHYLAVAGGPELQLVRISDAGLLGRIALNKRSPHARDIPFRAPSFSEDGARLLVAVDKELLTLDATTGMLLAIGPCQDPQPAGFQDYANTPYLLIDKRNAKGYFGGLIARSSGICTPPLARVYRYRGAGASCLFGDPDPTDGDRETQVFAATLSFDRTAQKLAQGKYNYFVTAPSIAEQFGEPVVRREQPSYVESPSQWQVDVSPNTAVSPREGAEPKVVDWGARLAAWSPNEVALYDQSSRSRETHWRSFDLRTGARTDLDVTLGTLTPGGSHIAKDKSTASALRQDGMLLAHMSVATEPSVVAVTDRTGKTVAKLPQTGRATRISWLGRDRLLVFTERELTCWALPQSTIQYARQLECGSLILMGSQLLGPSDAWFALPTSDGMQIVDSSTGNSLGQLNWPVPGILRRYAVSPSGRKIAAVIIVPNDERSNYRVVIWDLVSQEAHMFVTSGAGKRVLAFAHDDFLAVDTGHFIQIVDLVTRRTISVTVDTGHAIRFVDPAARRTVSTNLHLVASPDGRLWKTMGGSDDFANKATEVIFPNPALEHHAALFDPNRRVPDSKIIARIEGEIIGGGKWDAKSLAERAAKELSERGLLIGDGPYVLSVTTSPTVAPGPMLLTSDGQRVEVPGVHCEWSMTDEQDSVVWHQEQDMTLQELDIYKDAYGDEAVEEVSAEKLGIRSDPLRDIEIRLTLELLSKYSQPPVDLLTRDDALITGDQLVKLPIAIE